MPTGDGYAIAAQPSQSGEVMQTRMVLFQFGGLCQRQDAAKSTSIRRQFYRHAMSLLKSKDDGIIQETITKLAGDGGLPFIRESAESVAKAGIRTAKLELLDGEILPMLKILSYPKACNSAVLEQPLATLHNYFAGPLGTRMATVFDFVLQRLSDTWDLALAECSLVTLEKVVDCNSANIVDKRLSSIVASFDRLLADHDTATDTFARFQSLKCLDYLKRRLRIGEATPSHRPPAAGSVRAKFVLAHDLPGELSEDGPRHDNDHQDISKIKILPTMDEISSARDDYLPTMDPSQGHLTGIQWLIDRHFRLLRKDTVGQLTDAVHAEFSRLRGHIPLRDASKSAARTLAYSEARIEDIGFNVVKGLELIVSIPQPNVAKSLNAKKREEWWQASKRLQPGALVCILNPQGSGSALFCSVAEYNAPSTKQSQPPDGQAGRVGPADVHIPQSQSSCPWNDHERAFLPMKIVEPENDNIGRAAWWFRKDGRGRQLVLVEFPGVLLASFEATLATLQDMFRSPRLPFAEYLAPERDGGPGGIPPPHYSQRLGFALDMTSITTTESQLRFVPGEDPDIQSLERNTSLDHSQAAAVLEALGRSLALIEGPPGTGKSYAGEILVKILLANRMAARLGPILVVCYTNHALDQLLEHLYQGGVKNILRIGSRSKSEILEEVNLRVVAKTAERTRQERDILREARSATESTRTCIDKVLEALRRCDSPAAIRNFLESRHPDYYTVLFGSFVDEEGFSKVIYSRDGALADWLLGGVGTEDATRSIEVLEEETRLSAMTHAERALLHNHWKTSIRSEILAELLSAHESWQAAKAQIDRVHREVDARCLGQAQVIGVTTTGLARNVQLLRKIDCKVLLCEEAGEVLEAHLLTALLPSVEHAVFIGDHLQLRPQIRNYNLQSTNPDGQKYSLDVSLFERLVEPFTDDDARVPYSVLLTQRRMHPSIARLIRETLYPELEDAEGVGGYPPVAGMKKRLFWLHHEHEEQGKTGRDPTNTSVSNEWEAAMAAALVTHLVHQGEYSLGDVAVVVPYLAQLRLLRRLFEARFEVVLGDRDRSDLEEEAAAAAASGESPVEDTMAEAPQRAAKTSLSKAVRLATVDNFQGEEADVVVVSLVRSNPGNKPGFLNVFNRINVLLSRARHGLYVIGNAHTAGSVDMWARVLRILRGEGNYGTALELQCPRHPETRLLASEPDHFAQLAPDGGCNRPCEKRLDCGHKCAGRCHSDLLHGVFQCLEPCSRPRRGCHHACPRACGQPCEEKCSRQVDGLDIALSCGHRVTSARCCEAQDPATIVCRVATEKTVPGCGHSVEVPCCTGVDGPGYVCQAQCSAVLGCGHKCKRPCGSCRTRGEGEDEAVRESHGRCLQTCGRNYTTCTHSCRRKCHPASDCGPCLSACGVRCSHSRCGKKCYEPCAVCAEGDCASRCPHSQCSMPCAAPCDWIPCSRRCEQKLACGHQCPSFCGEMCPDATFCQRCAPPDVLSSLVDLVELREYKEIDLDEEPCLFLACGHVFTGGTLDGQMKLSKYYSLSAEGQPTGIRSASEPFSVDEIKLCPHCRGTLRNIARYGRIIRRALLDETTKRFVAWSRMEFAKIGSDFLDQQDRLNTAATDAVRGTIGRAGRLAVGGNRLGPVAAVVDWAGHGYFKDIMACRRRIEVYSHWVRREEQPLQRVADLVAHAQRQRRATGQFVLDESTIQLKGQLESTALLLRCDLFIITKFIELWRDVKERRTDISLDLSDLRRRSADLVDLAQKSVHPREIVEGYVFLAQSQALERCVLVGTDDQAARELCTVLRDEAEGALATARAIISRYPGSTAAVQPDVEAVGSMLRGRVFYSPVSTRELRTIYQAIGFSTGHWYKCTKGHPFVVADCGMPTEEAKCSECGSPVGGQDHMPAAGVTRAHEMEAIGTSDED